MCSSAYVQPGHPIMQILWKVSVKYMYVNTITFYVNFTLVILIARQLLHGSLFSHFTTSVLAHCL